MSIILLLFASLVIFLVSKFYSLWKLQQKSNTSGVGVIECLVKSRQYTFKRLMTVFENEKRKDGFIHFWSGTYLSFVAIHPETAKIVLKSNDFPKRFASASGYIRERFGQHLVSADGEDWKRYRTFVNSGFTAKAYDEYFPTFSKMTEKTLTKMESECENDIDCRSWYSKFALDLLGNSIFHYDFGRLDNKSTDAYNSYSQSVRFTSIHKFMLLFPWIDNLPLPAVNRLHEAADNLMNLFNQIIKDRQNGQKYDDILNNLLKSTETTKETGGLSQAELFSNLWIFFVAGHETTSSALTYECLCLAKYPDIQEKIYKEIQETVGDASPTIEDLSKLQYLDCFIQETMRLFPPVSFIPSRCAVRDVTVNDQVIPKDSVVGIFIGAIHRHPDFWPEPEKFDPDRFLPENKKGRHHYAYLPFSLGPRQCIGNIFSLIEQRLFLTRLLQKFRVLPPKNAPLFYQALPFASTDPVMIRLERR